MIKPAKAVTSTAVGMDNQTGQPNQSNQPNQPNQTNHLKPPKKKTPPNMNLFVSRVNDVPNDPYQFLSPRDLKVLAATNSFEKRNSKSKNMKYFLILLNILVIVWCYHHLLYQCNFDQSTHIPYLHHPPKFNYESIDSL